MQIEVRFSSVPVGRVRRPDNHPGKGPPPKPVLVAERPCWTPSENIPASVISGNAGGELFCLERSGLFRSLYYSIDHTGFSTGIFLLR